MKVRTDFEGMERIAGELQRASDDYRSLSTRLSNTAKSSREVWEGQDNIEFLNQIDPLQTDLNNMADQLQIASKALRTQKEIYMKHVEDNALSAKSLPHS